MSKIDKKKWRLQTLNTGKPWTFTPMFEVNTPSEDGQSSFGVATAEAGKDIECKYIQIDTLDENGKESTAVFNFLDLYMFIYFCANEELRQQLQMRYERDVSYIPYNVSFTIDEEEKRSGTARRRIELPVDELTMAIARNEAMKLRGMPVKPNMPTVIGPRGPTITSKLPKGRT